MTAVPLVVRLNAETMPMVAEERDVLAAAGARVVEIEGDAPSSIIEAARHADALMVIAAKVRAEVIGSLERCRIIARVGTGVDNIDVAHATDRGILVTNLPDFCIDEMADHTMALLLALARKLPEMHEATLAGHWEARFDPGLRRLRGRRLGLVGFGNTAKAIAARARAFGLEVVGNHHRFDPGSVVEEVPMVALDTLLETSDYVSLHVPLTAATKNMIGERELRRMRPDAYLINIARGAVVDEDALVRALKEGWIAGAGIDVFANTNVFANYGTPPTHSLFSAPNALFTPHAAACSVESLVESKRRAAEQVALVLEGRWPPHVLNPDVATRSRLTPPPRAPASAEDAANGRG
jgi:D-3-phosphoglycerate dehydrogenase / 2-oxoglutarate reductase